MRDSNDRSLWVGDGVIYMGSGKPFSGVPDGGYWAPPSGKIEPTETDRDAVNS